MLFELPDFEHIDATAVKEAVFWLHRYGVKARVVAGATDLLGLMKDRIGSPALPLPEALINIKTIPDLNRITYDEKKGLRIGAAVTLHQLASAEIVKEEFSLLSQAALQVGSTPLRYMGTLGGNLCQRPRCAYFRHPHFVCFKKGGTQCFAVAGEHRHYHSIFGKGRCVMAHPSDLAPALVALKAKAIVVSREVEKEIPLQNFFLGPNEAAETILKADELLAEIQIPNQGEKNQQVFLKHRIRHSVDFALASVAIWARSSAGICEDIRIVLGGVAPFPYKASASEGIIRGNRLNEALAEQAAEASAKEARPLSMNHYKVDLTKGLVKRGLTAVYQRP